MENKPIYYAKINYIKPKMGYELVKITLYNIKDYNERFGLVPFKMIEESNLKDHFKFYFYEENKDNFINVSKKDDEYVTNDKYNLDMIIESYQELTMDYSLNKEEINKDNLQEYMNKAKVKQKIKS